MPTFDVSEVSPAKNESLTFDPAEVTPATATPAPKPKSWLSRIGSYIPQSYADAVERNAEAEKVGNMEAGRAVAEYSPITGIPEMARGVKNVVSPDAGSSRVKGARQIVSGFGRTVAPLAIPAAIAAPVPLLGGMAAGMAVQTGVTKGLEAVGVDPDTAGLAGDVAGFVPPGAAVGKIAGKLRSPRPIDAPIAAGPAIPAPKPIEVPIPDAGPVPKGPKSAAESAQVFDPILKRQADEQEYARLFDQAEKRNAKAARQKPVVPESGIPEPVARGADARENLAREFFGKSFKDLDNPDRLAIDELVTEGAGSASVKPVGPTNAARKARQRGSLPITAADVAAVKAGVQKARTQMTDEYAPIKDFVEGKGLTPEQDPYVGARLYAGHAGKVDNRLNELRGILKPAKEEGLLEPMTKYAIYERHEELASRIPGYKLPNGQTLADIQAEKAALETALGPALPKVKQYVDGIRQYSDMLLTEAKDAGIISDTAYNAIKAKNQKYVPLQRLEYVADQLDKVPHGTKAFSVSKQDVYQRIQGSEKEVLDPLQAMIRNTYKVVGLIERNKVATQMADLASNPQFGGAITRLGKGRTAKRGEETFSVLRNGVKEEYVGPKEVVESLKGMNRKESDLVTKMASKSSAALRAGATTLNVPFVASNLIRDLQTATLVSKVGFTPLDWAKGFAAAIKRGDDFRDFMESGGSFSGFFERNQSLPSSVKTLTESTGAKVLKTVLNPIKLMETIGTTVELAPRIGVHMRSKAKGLSDVEAGFNARNATVDFAKSGTAMRVANQWVPFLNARLQGTINTFGAVKDRPGKSALTLSAIVGLPVISTYLWNRQFQDVLDDIAPYEKESNFVIVYGREKDEDGNYTQAIKIPKGDVGRIFGNPLENFLAHVDGKNPRALDELAMQVASDVSPVSFEKEGKFSGSTVAGGILPPTVKAGVESVVNKNLYTEREIVPKKLQDASPEQQYKADTPAWLVKLGEFTGTSPLKWQNAIGTQFGGLGRQLADPSKALGTMQKRFSGARGGEIEQRQWDAIGEAKRETADVRVATERDAQRLLAELEPMEPGARGARIQELIAAKKVTPETLETLGDLIKKKVAPGGAIGRALKAMPVEARAGFILSELQDKSLDQRRALFEEWQAQNLITPKVLEALEAKLAAQQ